MGRDFLKDQKAWVDFGEDLLQIQGGLITIKMFNSPRKSCLARLVNRISIPPQSVSIAKVKVKGQGIDNLSLIEPIRTLPTKNKVIGARTIANVQNSLTCVQIMNPTNE